jgi:hypothetical protein
VEIDKKELFETDDNIEFYVDKAGKKRHSGRDGKCGTWLAGQAGNPAGRPKLKNQSKQSQRRFTEQIPNACKKIIDSVNRRSQKEIDDVPIKDLLTSVTALSRQVDSLVEEREEIQINIVRTEGIKYLEPENAGETDWRLKRDRTYKELIAKLDAVRATVSEQTLIIERDEKRHQEAIETLQSKHNESIQKIFKDERLFDHLTRGIDEAERERIKQAKEEWARVNDDSLWSDVH